MKVVLDTNVLVSGLLSPFPAPGEIVRMTSACFLELCYDARILAEYEAVLHRPKFDFQKAPADALLDQIRRTGHSVASEPLKHSLPDVCDEPFLEVAIAGNVEYLVTGNLKHYPPSHRFGVKVVSPAEFLTHYRK